jgi:outer membrane lipoprotein LolB
MTRLIRLLPLAALVLTACTVTQPKGPGKSPDSPSGVSTSRTSVI